MTAAPASRCAMRRTRRELLDHVSIGLMHKPRGTLGAFPPPLAGRAIAFGADRLIPPPRSGGGSASEASRGGGTPPDPPRYARRATLRLRGREQTESAARGAHRAKRPDRLRRRQLPEDQDREIAVRRIVGLLHLDLGRADRLEVVAAEADEILGRALVDHQAEFLDRPRPVGAGPEQVVDALLGERRGESAAGGLAGALDRGQELVIEAILVLVFLVPGFLGRIGRAERGLRRGADARPVAVLDHGLGPPGKGLLPVIGGLQRPARREVLLHAAAGVIVLDLRDADANELLRLLRRQPIERLAGGGEMRRQRDAERAQQLGAVEASGDDAL